jgi:hypothetical protein
MHLDQINKTYIFIILDQTREEKQMKLYPYFQLNMNTLTVRSFKISISSMFNFEQMLIFQTCIPKGGKKLGNGIFNAQKQKWS